MRTTTKNLPASRFLNHTGQLTSWGRALICIYFCLSKALICNGIIELHRVLDIISLCDLKCGHILSLHVVVFLHLRISEHRL